MSIVLRAARSGDEKEIIRLIRALADYEHLADQVTSNESDIARDLFGEMPRVFCEIAEISGETIGFALWYYTYSTFRGRHGIWLEDLFVDPDRRGAGAGKALMTHLAKKCNEQGLARFEWWVLNWNKPSIDFYLSLGAQMQNEWTVCRIDGPALAKFGGLNIE